MLKHLELPALVRYRLTASDCQVLASERLTALSFSRTSYPGPQPQAGDDAALVVISMKDDLVSGTILCDNGQTLHCNAAPHGRTIGAWTRPD